MLKQGLRERSDTGTVWVARAGARIGVIGGERERRIWAPVTCIHTADSRKVKFLTSIWGKKPERCRTNQAVYGLIYAGDRLTLWLMTRY